MGRRRKARELLVQSLYASNVGHGALREAVEQQIARRRPSDESLLYIQSMTDHLEEQSEELDRRIDGALTGWNPDRVGAVERGILKLALAELLYSNDVPPKVVINEALELTRTYGTDDATRFVNGVLDRLRRTDSE